MFRTLARPLLASWFVYGGVQAILDPKPRAARAEPLVQPAAKEIGLEVSTESIVQAHGIASVLAASTLALSKTPRTSALVLAGLATLTAVAGRPFWLTEDEDQREADREAFVKNVALLGGVMIAATAGHSAGHKRRVTRRKEAARRRVAAKKRRR